MPSLIRWWLLSKLAGVRALGYRDTRALFLATIALCSHIENTPHAAGWSPSRTGEEPSAGSQGLPCHSFVIWMQNKGKKTLLQPRSRGWVLGDPEVPVSHSKPE